MSNTLPVRQVVVDDNDSNILYSSTWFTEDSGSDGIDSRGNFGPTLKSTLHGTNSSGSLNYAFSGTQMTVFGTTDIKSSSGVTDPSWECLIDNVSIGATTPFQFFENNWVLCSAENLSNAPHVLTVNANAHKRTFWLDYLKYTPSSSDAFNGALISVPHTDAKILYDSNWVTLGGNLSTMTNVPGSSMTFNFTGVSIAWYGVIPSELPITPSLGTYSIDGGEQNPFALQGLSPGEVTEYNQKFFETSILPSGPHSIKVAFESDSKSTPLTLQYLLVQSGTSPLHTGDKPSASLALPSSAPTSAPVSTLAGNVKKASTAGIVCGVVGLILLLCMVVFLLLRHRKQRNPTSMPLKKISIVNPFRVSLRPTVPRPIETTSLSTLNLFGPPSTPPASRIIPSHRRRRSSYGRFDQDNQPRGAKKNRRTPQPPVQPPVHDDPDEHTSLSVNQPSGSQSNRQEPGPSTLNDVDEYASYYGGYQTWAQTKALEAAAGSRPRDSYM